MSGTGALANLLRGTLAVLADVFVSYRRTDAPAAAGRVPRDLAEHFGKRRVFLDVEGIAPSSMWEKTISQALQHCKAGVIVIGRNWLAPHGSAGESRLSDAHDMVRHAISQLLKGGKRIFPILVEGAVLPDASWLPDELRPLGRVQATAIDNAGWDLTMHRRIRELELVFREETALQEA